MALLAKVKSSGKQTVDERLYEQTIEERDRSWIKGPFHSLDELENEVGACRICRRFPLEQGEKVRSIDDLSEP